MKVQSVRIGLSASGLVLAVAAIALNDTRLTWAAIGVLVVAVALRLLARRAKRTNGDST